ncbi:anti-sigma factor family protein [Streptomyces sp. NPDC058471]|uniref:anti-sigma factor family protein n=1 Tax=Streptomyces sp. NPDC058471 TaxID=3346516 RepID=UPI0036556041
MTQHDQDDAREPHIDRVGGRLASLVDGELTPDARARVLAHLATCANCQAVVDNQRRLKAIFNAVAPGPSVSVSARLSPLVDDFNVTHGREDQQRRREPRAERWASLAARMAGERRDLHAAWLADLDGDPEDGVSLTVWQQRRYALGFLVAAVRCRLRDGLGRLWLPVDWILTTRNRQEACIGLPPALLVIYIAMHDGVHTLLTEGWGWVGGCGVATFALVRWLQRVRGIELADRSPVTGE